MTLPKANPQRAGRKPGVRLPCGACFQMLTAAEWKGHHARCPDRLRPRAEKLLRPEWTIVQGHEQTFAVFRYQERLGPWCETRMEAVAQCPMEEK